MNLNCKIFSFHLRNRSNTVVLSYLRGNQFFHSLNQKLPLSLCQQCLQQSKHVSKFRCSTGAKRVIVLTNKFGFSQLQRLFSTKVSGHVKTVNVKAQKKVPTNIMRRLILLARPEKWNLTGAVILLFCSSAITMSVPFALGKVIDLIYTTDKEKMSKNLNSLTGLLFAIFVFGAVCNFGRVYLMNISAQRITRSLREKVFGSIMKQEVAFFDRNKTGELVNRLSADTSLVSNCVTLNISDGLRSLVMVGAGISMMFFMSVELALISLAIVPPVAAMAIVYGRFIRKMTTKVQDALASATQVAEERISNIRTVKAFSKEDKEILTYKDKMQVVLDLAVRESLARGGFFGMAGLSGNGIVLVVLYYGGTMVSGNTLTVGDLSAFLLYAAYIGVSLGGLTSFYSELQRGLGASTRLWQLIDRVPAIPSTGGLEPLWEPKGEVTFEDVIFAYPGRKDYPVLKGLTLNAPSSKVTAVVGSSGSGKSTLASLLLRLYDPESGKVKLDGIPVKDYNTSWLRAHIGFVSQEPVLFSGSIRDNVIYGAPGDIQEERLLECIKEANAFGFVSCLPHGLDTLVGERGVMLSGGQKQRIAIARALLKNPKILLLDEATSALDAESEHLVQEALERIMKGRTVLTIAHRLSTIKNADQIAVLEDGQIVEIGDYRSLMELKNGVFKRLVKHQTFHDPNFLQKQLEGQIGKQIENII